MNISIVWFRRDLRLQDNEAVHAAVQTGNPCLFVFLLDAWFFKQPEIGLLRVKFMFESLQALDTELRKYGNRLVILQGESIAVIKALMATLQTAGHQPHLFFNNDIQVTYGKQRDEAIITHCLLEKIDVHQSLNYFLLNDESQMNKWWKQYYTYQAQPQLKVTCIMPIEATIEEQLANLPQLSPAHLAQELTINLPEPRQQLFHGGEPEARRVIYSFLKDRVDGYHWKLSRPFLAQNGATSLLGPHLAFGTISNRTVFQSAEHHMQKIETKLPKRGFAIATYLDRLRWRDSFTQRLWFHPEYMWQNRFPEFNSVYNEDPLDAKKQEYFKRWKNGETGFPLLDAAMRQLAQDGFINFRMRAMAATFLTINCRVSWHHGARHFMNCLVDGDIAINHWQWQMQAGITNPLSPTFRMYNPSKNFKDRDPSAQYVHFWLPETVGKSVDKILEEAQPMLDFNQTRKTNGKVIADLRAKTRERILQEKGLELDQADAAHRVTKNYKIFTAQRYGKPKVSK